MMSKNNEMMYFALREKTKYENGGYCIKKTFILHLYSLTK
jgi:hypothetical protein